MKTLHFKPITTVGRTIAAVTLTVTAFFSHGCVLTDKSDVLGDSSVQNSNSGTRNNSTINDTIRTVTTLSNRNSVFSVEPSERLDGGIGCREAICNNDAGHEIRDGGSSQDGGSTADGGILCTSYNSPTRCDTTTTGTAETSDYIGVPLRSSNYEDGSEIEVLSGLLGVDSPFILVNNLPEFADYTFTTSTGVTHTEYQHLLLKGETAYSDANDTIVLKQGAQFAYSAIVLPPLLIHPETEIEEAPEIEWMGENRKILYDSNYRSYMLAKIVVSGKLNSSEVLDGNYDGANTGITISLEYVRADWEVALKIFDSCGELLRETTVPEYTVNSVVTLDGRTVQYYVGQTTFLPYVESADIAIISHIDQLAINPGDSGLKTVIDENGEIVAIGRDVAPPTIHDFLPGSLVGWVGYDQSGNGKGYSFTYEGLDINPENIGDYTHVTSSIEDGSFGIMLEGNSINTTIVTPYNVRIRSITRDFLSFPDGTVSNYLIYAPMEFRLFAELGADGNNTFREIFPSNPNTFVASLNGGGEGAIFLSHDQQMLQILFIEPSGGNTVPTNVDPRFIHRGNNPGRYSFTKIIADDATKTFVAVFAYNDGAVDSSLDLVGIDAGYINERGSILQAVYTRSIQQLIANRVGKAQFTFSTDETTCTYEPQ
ncbi:MAG: hypothetical protein Q7S22_05075 [Candidatus Micrarchaeota archaeon]|nr:hypothetical protein [Candidatus Micrarchaeota archaeon]